MRFADQWSGATVLAIRDVAASVREFLLRPDDGDARPYAVGSHINVGVIANGQPDTRSYSLVGAPRAEGYKIAVQRAPQSRGGSAYMWGLKAGARLQMSHPASLVELDWSRQHFCLIAGGIGITPVVGMASALMRRGASFELHYAVRSGAEAAYLDELQAMLGERLRVYAAADKQRLDLGATLKTLPGGAMAFVCGPMRLLDDARRQWTADGRMPTDLRYETFGSSGLLPTQAFTIRIRETGAEIVVPEGRSMLDALNDAGYEVMSDCRRGECGVCCIDVADIQGAVDHRDVFLSEHQKREGRKICPCVSRAAGTVTVDTLYRQDAIAPAG
jgi:vanillate O-demethylase ferredoxin subunit